MPNPKSRTKKPVTIKENKKGHKSSSREIKIIQRQTAALDLRRQGASYRRIAARLIELNVVELTYAEGQAYKDVKDAISRMLTEQKEIAEDNLRLDLERLDELMSKVWSRAAPPRNPETQVEMPADLFAVTAVLQILDRRERLLNYKALWEKPADPNINFNVDLAAFTTEEIIEMRRRVGAGENLAIVATEIQQRKQKTTPDGNPPA